MNLDEGDDDDFFGEPESISKGELVMGKKTVEKASRKMRQEGYINGKAEAEQQQVQRGFDTGFEQGMTLGAICGQLYARFRILVERGPPFESSDILCRIDVQKLLFETFPESYGNAGRFDSAVAELRQLCERLCPHLRSDLERAILLMSD